MSEDCNFWSKCINLEWDENNLVQAPSSFIDITFQNTGNESNDSSSGTHGLANCPLPFGRSKLFKVPIKNAKILVRGEGEKEKKVIEIILDIKDIPLEFFPGDTIGILPENTENDVNTLIELLSLEEDIDKVCNISINSHAVNKKAKIPIHLPQSCTLRTLFQHCVSFSLPPRKQFFRLLYDFSKIDDDKKILGAFCTKDSKVFNTALKYKFNLISMLKYFTSCHPPLTMLLEQMPRLLPRPYSIANSPLVNKNEIKIIFSVLNSDPGITTKMMEQLTFEYLENPRREVFLNIYLRNQNHFRYTEEEYYKNVIMIGVGCAVAPFIGFMEHKSEIRKERKHKSPGNAWLFTGFRHPNVALYKTKIEEFQKLGIINRVFESYSQYSDKYNYVQECIADNAKDFVNFLLDANTILYVCADGAKISNSIQETIENCIAKILNCDQIEAKRMITVFKKESKYREDIWV